MTSVFWDLIRVVVAVEEDFKYKSTNASAVARIGAATCHDADNDHCANGSRSYSTKYKRKTIINTAIESSKHDTLFVACASVRKAPSRASPLAI